ncbi:MAG TPA: ATPase domain-containing protein [Steroidobacteraceae bacterium]|nr:ATPase domain-containing protein [Steroidobacteraceae bacterium]
MNDNKQNSKQDSKQESLLTGVDGLDDVLQGGLPAGRLYLIEGDPGSGKTTVGMQFLLEGARRGERCLFITLSESEEDLRYTASAHGWKLDGIDFMEVIPSEESLGPDSSYRMYHPSEVELGETIKSVFGQAERIRPRRVIIDSVSELRLLAANPLRYRRQVLALKRYFARHGTTVVFTDDQIGAEQDVHLHSLAHGVITLERVIPEYGTMRRRLQVGKLRGRAFREGYHDFAIRRGGVVVYPRLVASEHRGARQRDSLESGLKPLDALLGGGLAKGTSTLVMGAAGTGKSSLATQFALAAAARGEKASVFIFDESIPTFLERSAGLGMQVAPLVEEGSIRLRQVDPAELSPGEFAHAVREAAQDGTSLIVIDSLNGYLNAMPSEQYLTLHLHELLTYLGQQGVTTLLLMTQHGIVSHDAATPVDASYLADTVMLMRYFEAAGEVRQAISVIKKRTGRHERTIRELTFDNGIVVGEPLRNFQGVLTGTPQIIGKALDHDAGRRADA